MWVLWIICALVLIALEAHTQTFFALVLGIGFVGATVTDVLGGALWLQGVVLAVVSLVGVIAVRPLLRRWLGRPVGEVVAPGGPTFIGQSALTLDVVGDEHHPGHASFNKETWLAQSDTGEEIPAGVSVTVVAVRGTTLVIAPNRGS